jgi:hypothetical protein
MKQILDEYYSALKQIDDLPPGDLRETKLTVLGKAFQLILKADKETRMGQPIMDLIFLAREKINHALSLAEQKPSIYPASNIPDKIWQQLDLEFNNQKTWKK